MPDPQQPTYYDPDTGKPVAQKFYDPDTGEVVEKKTKKQGFFSSLWELANPPAIADGLVQMGKWMMNPAGAGIEIGQTSKAYLDQGKPLGAVPLIGPPAQKAADQIRNEDYGGAAGTMTGMFLPEAFGRVSPTGRVAIRSRKAPVAAAVDTAISEGVPLGLADVGVRNAARLGFAADATSIAGFRDWSAPVIQGFETWGGRIREQQRPGPRVTPEEAGAGVSQRQRAGMASEAAKQDTAFGTIRQVAGQHVEMRPVIRPDANGNPVTVMEPMAAPVDVRAVKAALAPEVKRLDGLLTDAQKANDPGYTIMRNLLKGDDFMPLDSLLEQLSAVGEKQRGTKDAGLRSKGQGKASLVWSKLNTALDQAVAALGPDAPVVRQALSEGRSATKAKYGHAAILKRLGQTNDIPEPVTAYEKLVLPEDKSIGILSRVAQHSPAEAVNVGRAWLEARIGRAFRHGDVEATRSILNEWESLGPKTKDILYPDPQVRQQITDFMLSLRTWAESPNPSGTGAINAMLQSIKPWMQWASAGGTGAAATAMPQVLAGQAIWSGVDVALHSKLLAKLATRGLTLPSRAAQQAVGAAGTMGAMAGYEPEQYTPPTTPSLTSATAPPKPETAQADIPPTLQGAKPGTYTLKNGTVWKVDAAGGVTQLK